MISKDVEFWIEILNKKEYSTSIANREIYVWGAYSKGYNVAKHLEDLGFYVRGYVDSYKSGVFKEKSVYLPGNVLNIVPKPYIIVAIENIRDVIVETLESHGFYKGEDYLYFSEMITEIVVSGVRGYYEDSYHNSFYYKGKSLLKNVQIFCKGGNNKVVIGDNFVPVEGSRGGG